MILLSLILCIFASSSLRLVAGHASIWHPSMYGFNVTMQTFSYDNRPVAPLMNMPFSQWWFHGHLAYPPHPEDVFELPAGKNVTTEIACNKGATTYFASSEGGNVQDPNNPNNVCPGSPTSEYHTTGLSDVKGCGLAIAYKSNATEVQPDDFTIFSINQTCVWDRYTNFAVPERMPPCPNNMCTCAFFWIHSPDSGGEQNYMNGFQCRITNSTSNVGLATSKVPRRCGADPANKKPAAVPGNCTYGAKQPFYWFQAEQNNMFEGTYSPPFYTDLYNFKDGAQTDIFQDSYASIPVPGPNQTALPVLAVPGATTPAATVSASVTPLATPTTTPAVVGNGSTTASAPTTTGSSTKSMCKRSASAFSRRSLPSTDRSSAHALLARKLYSMTRRSRTLNPEKRSELWRPF
ncbi:hypothetical protein HYDPIDRAFT_30011 [Hydnomerulius pinastri MD-312]|uniref:Lytic polysaccharide monooxygenase n=1 Tax=Hydnomerulius pinastri MD-312 TaxID=994086 RepID=A0A0C9WDA6_9AGAM|nr:hypothetical protein HYDPIDRAFT_30011 [Hydnomerulius pinastri MD-312]